MKHTTTAKVQLKVDPDNKAAIIATMDAYKRACNYVSDYIYTTKTLNKYTIQAAVYHNIRTLFGLRSQMAISSIKTVIAKYKTIIKNHNGWKKPRFNKPQLDLVWNRDYSIKKGSDIASINTLHGRIKLFFYKQGFTKYFTGSYKFGTAKIVCMKDKLFLYIPATMEIDTYNLTHPTNIVGVDRGVRFIVTTYNSVGETRFYSGKYIKHKRMQYERMRRTLIKVKTPSSRKRLKSIGRRENRWIHDINHCVSKALVSNNPIGTIFVLEDLSGIRSELNHIKSAGSNLGRLWAYKDLETKLIYKAYNKQQLVVHTNPAYTSQRCPKCGNINKTNRNKKVHLYSCKNCGYRSNDDRIGAMNLYNIGVKLFTKNNNVFEHCS